MGNHVSVEIDGVDDESRLSSKVRAQRLKPGDRLYLRAGGGGGFGAPLERDAERVADDVKQGYVSAESARENYLVALDGQHRVDVEKTRKLRSGKQR